MDTDFVRQFRVIPRAVADATTDLGEISLFDAAGAPVTLNAPSGATFAPITTATAIGTAAKTTTSPEPAANTLVPVKFTNGNSASSPTLAFNGGSARAIQLAGVASTGAKITVAANGVALFWFDGTILHQVGVYS